MSKFSSLKYLMQCYLHQDWSCDYPTMQEVLIGFANEESKEYLVSALKDLNEVISKDLSEDECYKLTAIDMGCDYYPLGDNLTYKEWMIIMRDILESELHKSDAP